MPYTAPLTIGAVGAVEMSARGDDRPPCHDEATGETPLSVCGMLGLTRAPGGCRLGALDELERSGGLLLR